MDIPFTVILAGAVTFVCSCMILYVGYKILFALYYNICFHVWHYKVMKVNGRGPQWVRFPAQFILMWLTFLIWNKHRDKISVGVSYWKSPKDKFILKETRTRTEECATLTKPIDPI